MPQDSNLKLLYILIVIIVLVIIIIIVIIVVVIVVIVVMWMHELRSCMNLPAGPSLNNHDQP